MDAEQRTKVFEYVYAAADTNLYMAMDTAQSTAFQTSLGEDSQLMALAGETLPRKYIKDTILNKYSKDRRYIVHEDIIEVLSGVSLANILGTKADLENGIFFIQLDNHRIRCTSSSIDQWETSIKRFGKKDSSEARIAFLTCGGVERSVSEVEKVKETLTSYDIIAVIVRPNQHPIDIKNLLPPLVNFEVTDAGKMFPIDTLVTAFAKANLILDKSFTLRFIAALLTKRFCILTGLSGSGKTKIAEAFSQWITAKSSQYALVAVGADWTSNENLLGYADALNVGTYKLPANGVLELILEARDNPKKPYFLILDEMNLSHVERYFADFLSTMESQSAVLSLHGATEDLKADKLLIPGKLPLPNNLFIIGTVNVDETTYMFSPKVLDRGNVIEFKASYNQMSDFLGDPKQINLHAMEGQGVEYATTFTARSIADAEIKGLKDASDNDISVLLKNDLMEVFESLSGIGAEFGFRTAKEIARFLVIHKELSGDDWQYVDALDAQVLQKLMPKLHGSARKLEGVLIALEAFAKNRDLPQTLEKIGRMKDRLTRDGFTSFAEA
jgi:hypothetical protein